MLYTGTSATDADSTSHPTGTISTSTAAAGGSLLQLVAAVAVAAAASGTPNQVTAAAVRHQACRLQAGAAGDTSAAVLMTGVQLDIPTTINEETSSRSGGNTPADGGTGFQRSVTSNSSRTDNS